MNHKQSLIGKADIKENSKRKFIDYKGKDLFLIINKARYKGKTGTNVITQRTNGTFFIHQPYGTVRYYQPHNFVIKKVTLPYVGENYHV